MPFIKNLREKKESWDRGGRPSEKTIAKIAALPSFQKMVADKNAAIQEAKAERMANRQTFDKGLTGEAEERRVRAVIDDTAGVIKSHGDLGINDCKTFEQARAKAEAIAYRRKVDGQ